MAEVLERTGNKVKFKVVVPAEEVNSAFRGVYNALARSVRVPGFRPGKAPKSVLEKRVGTDFVLGEVREQLVKQAYPKAVSELELVPVDANVTVGEVREGEPFEFTVDAENYPTVALPEWQGFALEATTPEVGEEDVARALENVRQSRATYDPAERPAEENDLASVEVLEGEDAGKVQQVYLDNRTPAYIREAIAGKTAGDELSVPLEAPAETEGEAQEGQEGAAASGTLRVRLLDVKAKSLPALDDDLAKAVGLETLEELQNAVRTDLEARARQEGLSRRKDEFVAKLAEGATLEVPEALVERRRHAMEHDIEHDLERQGLKLADYRQYLEGEGKLSDFEADLTRSAAERVRRDLALERLTEDLGTRLTDEEWRNALESYARSNQVSVAKLRDVMGEDGIENFKVVVTRDKALEEALGRLGQPS